MVASEVRAYKKQDAPALARIHDAVYRDGSSLSGQLRRRMATLLQSGGEIWVILIGGLLVGYASLRPVPGLDGIYDLQGCIVPERQRQGFGSELLNFLLAELQGSDVRQLSHMVNSKDTPAAQFLHCHGFFVEHEECFLSLKDLSQLSPGQIPPGYTLRTFSRPAATRHFRRLYDLIFAGLPWYQPYHSDKEVAADLVDPADLLFLLDNHTPIGFLWVHWSEFERGEIEPVGILPAYRRQGLGCRLMLAALRQMAEQGAREVALGVWNNNVAALNLYRSLGFRQSHTVIYLALNLNYR